MFEDLFIDEAPLRRPDEFSHRLGNLHDAKVCSLAVDLEAGTVELVVDDLFSNFVGLPEYPGRTPIKLVADEVRDLKLEFAKALQVQRVSDFEFVLGEAEGGSQSVRAQLALQSGDRMEFACTSIRCSRR